MQHIHDSEATPTVTPTAMPTSTEELVAKVKALEKDLYYYRKTSRDLKKKLQTAGSITSRGSGISVVGGAEEGVNSAPELEGGKVGGRAKAKSKRRKDVILGTDDSKNLTGQGDARTEVSSESTRLERCENTKTETGGGSGRILAGVSQSPLTKKQIQEVISIHAHKESRGQDSPLKSEGSFGVVGSQVVLKTAEGFRTAQAQGAVEPVKLQPVIVKRSRKELRQLR